MSVIAKPSKGDFEYEKVKIDEWIMGQIVDVQERLGVEKTYKDKEGNIKVRHVDMVRLKFELEGYQYPHYSRWNTLSTNENSNLYKNYIKALFGSKYPPDTLLDIEKLKGLFVKTMWDETKTKDGGVFQFVSKIRLNSQNDLDKVNLLIDETMEQEEKPEEEIPF